MSNRLIGILIVFIFVVFGFIYWTYFYIPSKIEEKQRQEQIALEQRKQVNLIEIKEEEKESVKKIDELTSQEKIEELKRINSFYKIIEIESDIFYFSKKDNILELKLGEKIVGNFDLVPVDKLSIFRIYSSRDDYYILNGNKKYIYNFSSDILLELELTIDIDYIKRNENLYIIKTEKGSFIYDKTSKNLEYFTFFEDFVYYKDFYIGIIKKDDERRLKNLSISSINGNSIFKYNPKTKEKKSLYETNINLEKIYNLGNEIYFIDSNNKTYKLENLDQ